MRLRKILPSLRVIGLLGILVYDTHEPLMQLFSEQCHTGTEDRDTVAISVCLVVQLQRMS